VSALPLLLNRPLRCGCGGLVTLSPYCLEDDTWAECGQCERAAVGSSRAEAEQTFFLAHGFLSVEEQAIQVICRDGCAGDVVCLGVMDAGRDYRLPSPMRMRRRLGCIVVDTSTDDDVIAERDEEKRSYVLFLPGRFKDAWSIARRLRRSHPGVAAMVGSAELAESIFIALGPWHHLCLDGLEVQP
jgi:hypothetical protein